MVHVVKIKRIGFIGALIALFSFCYVIMNQHYDELARYPHTLNEQQRDLVIQHLDTDGINFLISSKIEPDQFLPYIEIEGFDLTNTLWYDSAYKAQKEEVSKDFIVRFINKYKDQMSYTNLPYLIENYSFNVLIRFFDEGDQYQSKATLIPNPNAMYTLIKNNQTLYTYEPKNLVSLGSLPHDSILANANDILIQSEVLAPLSSLLEAARDINGMAYGDMRVVNGYLSYEDQSILYENAKNTYGDDVYQYWDMPGHSEYKLGYTVQLLPNGVQPNITNKEVEENQEQASEEEKEQEIWLKDNAYKYGFIIRYPSNKEDVTGKKGQPYTLRYVGKELAKEIHDKNSTLEKTNTSKYK